MSIYLKSIALRNIGGLPKFDCNFHDVTFIVGSNGQGKTTVLDSIRMSLQDGVNRDLLRAGAKSGQTILERSDGWKIDKVIDPGKSKGYTQSVEDPNGGKTTSGAATMIAQWTAGGLFDARALISLVTSKRQEDRDKFEKFLLANLPMSFDAKEVNEATEGLTNVAKTLNLAELNRQYDTLYNERTDINRDVEHLKGSIALNEKSVEDVDVTTDWEAEKTRLTKEVAQIDAKMSAARGDKRAKADKLLSEKRAEIEAAIQSLRNELTEFEKALEEEFNRAVAETTAMLQSRRSELSEQLGLVTGRAQSQTMAAGIQRTIDEEKSRLQGAVTKVTLIGIALEGIDKLKTAKLKQLPIPGLDIRQNGNKTTITIDGVPVERLNTQKQLYLCVKLVREAQKAANCELCLMILDNGENLDRHHLCELADACRAAGVQLIVAVVEDEPLQVLNLEQFKELIAKAGVGA